MNFSYNGKLSKVLSMILVFCLMTTLFAGCKRTETPGDTSADVGPNLNLSDDTTPSATQTEPAATTPVEVNENTATVTGNLNIRSSPSTDAVVTGTLYAGDKVEISRRETVAGYEWAYIISPVSGWIVMDFVEMDIKSDTPAGNDTSTPAGNGEVEAPSSDSTSSTNIKGVVTVNALNIRSEASTDTGKIQGSYDKGDVITILETKNGWGRTNKGWIKMEYVNTSGTTGSTTNSTTDNTTSNTTTNNTTTNNSTTSTTITSNGSTTVVWKGVVRVQELNVRSNASSTATRLGSVTYGQRVEVLEKSGNWGRISKGWICLDYVYEDGTTGTKTATGTVTGNGLNIRSGPGKTYASVGSYNSGDQVSILEQFTYNGTTWGCTKKGWISMDYVDTGDSDSSDSSDDSSDGHTGTITASTLNIRSGPGKDYASVGSLEYGDRVTIEYEKIVDDVSWGKIAKGWISMNYVDLD